MATQVIMPQLGESVVEGTVSKWLKVEGQAGNEVEPLREVNPDKVDTEIPSPASGVLLRIVVPEGQTVQAGTVLAMIGAAGEAVPEGLAAGPAGPRAGAGTGGRITKKDVLAHVRDLPAAGSIAPAWEQAASGELFRPTEEVFGPQASLSTPAPGQVIPPDSVPRQIAEHMLRSRRTTPHV